MEAVGLTVGVAGLFAACVELVDRIDAYNQFGIESHGLMSRFEADKVRFKRWGSSVGLDNGQWEETHDPQLHNHESLVKYILKITEKILEEAESACSNIPDKFREHDDSLLAISGEHTKTTTKSPPSKSIRAGLVWAFKGRNKFANQVDLFSKQVEALYKVVPPTDRESRLVRRSTKLEDNIYATQIHDQPESTSVSKDFQLLFAHLRLESKNAVDDWLDVTRFNDQHNMNQVYDKKVSLRLKGTCGWILRHPAYRAWTSDDFPNGAAKLLWISASAGSGKTILCASLIEHLQHLDLAPVAYFFASEHAQSSGEPSVIIRSWIAQLVQQYPDLLKLFGESFKAGQKATDSTIWSLFRSIISDRNFILILDGFDEYNRVEDVRAEFLQKLKKATRESGTRVLVSSRNENDTEAELSPSIAECSGHLLLECKISKEDVRHDILQYSRSVIDRSLPDKNDDLKRNLATELAEKCDGMFLWIKLQRGLRKGKSPKELYKAVKNMPTGLTETYERNWKQILARDAEDREQAMVILRWVTFALRPLTVVELTEALVFESSDFSTGAVTDDLDDKIENIGDEYISTEIIDMCASLVEVRAEKPEDGTRAKTVHLVHASVREFLISKYTVRSNQKESSSNEHNCIATTCLTYLNCNEVWLEGGSGYKYAFVQYAGKYWNSHVKGARQNPDLLALVGEFLRHENVSFTKWADFYSSSGDGDEESYQDEHLAAMPLYYAALFDLTSTMQSIWDKDKDQLNTIGGKYGTALQAACWKGHAFAFDLLISWGADPDIRGGKFGVAVNAAIDGNRRKMVETLIGMDVNLTLQDARGRTSLYIAAFNGHSEIVELLVMVEGRGELEVSNKHETTPLNAASFNGHLEVVRLLLEKGADLAAANDEGMTPLYAASLNGHLEVVKLLVVKDADITAVNKNAWTPLNAASFNGHLEVVTLLLEKGADIAAANNDGATPLYSASLNGHLEVVTLLLEKGADIAAANNDGVTPLYAASCNGKLEVVKLLIKKGADITATDNDGWTPLYAASLNDSLEVVRLLLENGADITATDNDGWTPLYVASTNGHLKVVRLLLENGADITATTNDGWTPLYAASCNGHHEVVRLLLEKGANVNYSSTWRGSSFQALAHEGRTDLLCLANEHYHADPHLVDSHGRSPLHLAAHGGHIDSYNYLVSLGLDMKMRDKKGDGVVEYASSGGSTQVLNAILDNRFELLRGSDHWNPLHWACRSGHKDIIERLSQEGFRSKIVAIRQPEGEWSPIAIALFHGHEKMLKELTAAARSVLGEVSDGLQLHGRRHGEYHCDGCFQDIYGPRFYCRTCVDFDYCFMCKPFLDYLHEDHEWDYIEYHVGSPN